MALDLDTAIQIPIAHLSPLATNSSSKVIKAIVTLTWPYSSATGTVAFLLSEPDFRLRRTRGQVRVQFAGSSAKAVKTAGIASGDEVTLSLDGVEWIQDEVTVSTPGRGVEFELKFAEKLLLQFKQEDLEEVKRIDIDHPAQEPEVSAPIAPTNVEPELEVSPAPCAHGLPRITSPLKDNEYASPAFIKRARTSYGSMFDSDYDPFKEEDGTIPGKGRKRIRLSSSWRYSSRSPTPEVEEAPAEVERGTPETASEVTPRMTDEGCQTVGLEEDSAAETLATFARQATNIGVSSYPELRVSSEAENMIQSPEALLHHQPTQNEILEQVAAPSSPRLTPVPSDNLPEVSPILTHKPFLIEEPTSQANLVQENQVPNSRPEPQSEASGVVDEQDVDIYTASPQRRISTSDFTSVNPSLGNIGLEQPALGKDYVPENLYGQWEGETAQLNYPASPDRNGVSRLMPDGMEGIQEEFQDERSIQSPNYEPDEPQYENGQNNQSPNYEPEEPQYPDLDIVMQGGQNLAWSARPSTINYPRLPGHDNEIELYPPRPRSAGMSRSQSAAIDLTESSDEEEEQIDNPIDEGDDYENGQEEGQEDEEDGGDDESQGEEIDVRQMAAKAAIHYSEREDEDEEDRYAYSHNYDVNPEYGDVEEPSDDEEDIQNPQLQDQDLGSEGDYHDEEEEEEEEEEEGSYYDEEEALPAQGPPVVIDLLSSDDENDIPAPKPSTRPSRMSVQHQSEMSDSESEGEEEDAEPKNAKYSREDLVGTIPRQEFENGEDEDAQFEEDSADGEASDYDDDMEDRKGSDSRHAAPQASSPPLGEGEEQADEEDDRMEEGEEQNANEDSSIVPQRASSYSSGQPLPPMPGPPPPKPNLFASVFGIDGAYDEPDEEPRFPTMMRIPSFPSTLGEPIVVDEVASGAESPDESPKAQESGKNNDQLLTPDATQSFGKLAATRIEISETRVKVSSGAVDGYGTNVEASFETAVQNQDRSHIEHSDIIVTGNGVIELITNRPTSSRRVSTTPAPTITVEPTELLTETVQDEIVSPPTQEGILEPMGVDMSGNEDAPAPDVDQEREPKPLTKDTARINIQAVKDAKEDEPEEFDEDLLAANYPSATQRVTRSQSPSKRNGHPGLTVEEPAYTRESPRRSHRRAKSSTSTTHSEAGLEGEVLPMTPIKEVVASEATNFEEEVTPIATKKSQDTTKGYDASIELSLETPKKGHDASIELALSELDSPAKNTRDLRTSSNIDLKFRLSRVLRIELPTFTPLKNIKHAYSKLLEVFAIATSKSSEATRAKKGPRNYLITFNVTDQTIAPNSVIQVQVFRPYKDALPVIEAGDGVLLRNFQGIAIKDKGFGLRSAEGEGSSWAVFKEGKEEVRGPPVEYGEKEKAYMADLKGWYAGLHNEAKKILARVNAKI